MGNSEVGHMSLGSGRVLYPRFGKNIFSFGRMGLYLKIKFLRNFLKARSKGFSPYWVWLKLDWVGLFHFPHFLGPIIPLGVYS